MITIYKVMRYIEIPRNKKLIKQKTLLKLGRVFDRYFGMIDKSYFVFEARYNVLDNSDTIVIGPTPPGTGVIAEDLSLTFS